MRDRDAPGQTGRLSRVEQSNWIAFSRFPSPCRPRWHSRRREFVRAVSVTLIPDQYKYQVDTFKTETSISFLAYPSCWNWLLEVAY